MWSATAKSRFSQMIALSMAGSDFASIGRQIYELAKSTPEFYFASRAGSDLRHRGSPPSRGPVIGERYLGVGANRAVPAGRFCLCEIDARLVPGVLHVKERPQAKGQHDHNDYRDEDASADRSEGEEQPGDEPVGRSGVAHGACPLGLSSTGRGRWSFYGLPRGAVPSVAARWGQGSGRRRRWCRCHRDLGSMGAMSRRLVVAAGPGRAVTDRVTDSGVYWNRGRRAGPSPSARLFLPPGRSSLT
jgi:hypothetical protein